MSSKDLITFVFVSDLATSDAFYTQALGLELTVDQGDCRIYRVADGAFLGICLRPDRVQEDGMIITFVTNDVAGSHERMVAAGAAVESPPTHSEQYQITHAFYRDPDGHLIEIQRFDDPEWATK